MERALLQFTAPKIRSVEMKSISEFQSTATSDVAPTGLARGLGWFSLALGVGELAWPRSLAKLIGVDPDGATPVLMRLLGAREILAGASVLLQPQKPAPLWARVAGDIVDLGLLGLAAGTKRTSGARVAGAVAAVAGVMALDVIAARRAQKAFEAANEPIIFSVTINKPPREVYDFYRKLERLPMFMDWLESVTETTEHRSHWVAKLPLGTVEWDAVIVEDTPGECIAWEALDSTIETEGRVTFAQAPGRNMTEVRVEMKLGFTGMKPSILLAKYFAKPQIKGDLRRLKQVIETGEVLMSDASQHTKPHPAQPSDTHDKEPKLFIPNPPTAEKGVTR
jgi:uncharacterized membrane protein